MDNFYEEYLFRSSEALRIEQAKLQARLQEIHNTSGLHTERAELRERITAVGLVLSERALF